MKLHDPVLDTFGTLPQDFDYRRRLEQIEFELEATYTTGREKEIFNLYYKQLLTVTEIADLLEMNKSTVSRHLSTFRQRCRLRYLYLTK